MPSFYEGWEDHAARADSIQHLEAELDNLIGDVQACAEDSSSTEFAELAVDKILGNVQRPRVSGVNGTPARVRTYMMMVFASIPLLDTTS